MQEAYVKRVIKVFKLKPEDLATTPQYFCEVFECCEFLTGTTKAIETSIYLYNNLSICVCMFERYLLPQFWSDLNFKGTYGILGSRRT